MSSCGFVAFAGSIEASLTYLWKCYWIKTGILRDRILNDVGQMRQKIKVDRNQDGQRRTSVVGPLWSFFERAAASQQ